MHRCAKVIQRAYKNWILYQNSPIAKTYHKKIEGNEYCELIMQHQIFKTINLQKISSLPPIRLLRGGDQSMPNCLLVSSRVRYVEWRGGDMRN